MPRPPRWTLLALALAVAGPASAMPEEPPPPHRTFGWILGLGGAALTLTGGAMVLHLAAWGRNCPSCFEVPPGVVTLGTLGVAVSAVGFGFGVAGWQVVAPRSIVPGILVMSLGTTVAVVSLVAGAPLVALAGLPVMAIGAGMMAYSQTRDRESVAWAPFLLPGGAGLALAGRF